jgi:hypothetical protein
MAMADAIPMGLRDGQSLPLHSLLFTPTASSYLRLFLSLQPLPFRIFTASNRTVPQYYTQLTDTHNTFAHTGSVQMLMGQSHGLAAVDLAPMKGDGKRLGNLEVGYCTALNCNTQPLLSAPH